MKASHVSLAVITLLVSLIARYSGALWGELASFSEVRAWLPTWDEFVNDLRTRVTMPVADPKREVIFNAYVFSDWCDRNYWVVFTVCPTYLATIPLLKAFMRNRERILATPCVVAWNLFLSAFSFLGMFFIVPKLLGHLYVKGFESTVCDDAGDYGFGYSGFWIFCFIMSKLFETVDTLWLLLRKSPVIALQWYHHATVMLFCWHAYGLRTGYSGMWYAGMNYTVHSFMYLYFAAMMGTPWTRGLAKPFAMTITLMQILQMVMGMFVLFTSVVVQAKGRTCHTNKSNTILGLAMYFSYFVLFAKLFLGYYVFGGKEKKEAEQSRRDAKKKELGVAKESNGKMEVKEVDTVKES